MSLRLIQVCVDGNHELAEKLLCEDCDAACSIDMPAPDGTTPVLAAIMWSKLDVLRVLFKYGANGNAPFDGTRWTPLHAATLQENADMCQLLLENHADPLMEDEHRRRPVDYASAAPEAVWKHFEARGCERSSKADLIEKSIIKKVADVPAAGCDLPEQPVHVAKPSMRHLDQSRPTSAATSETSSLASFETSTCSKDSSPTSSRGSTPSVPESRGATPSTPTKSKPFEFSKKKSFEKSLRASCPEFSASMKAAPAAAPVNEFYSRPGSAYVKKDTGASMGMPPPPPSRHGRALAHGETTRKVRNGPPTPQVRAASRASNDGQVNVMSMV